MKKHIFLLVVFIVPMADIFSPHVMAEIQVSDKDESVKWLGVAWNIADDRKMENINGRYEPEGLDKYMKRYFDELSSKIDQLLEQGNRLEKKVDDLLSKSGRSLGSPQQEST